MNNFGLTSIDGSLSILGLNAAWQFIDFIFFKSHLGLVAFAIGFVVAVWRFSKEGNLQGFAVFIFISLLVFLLLIIPRNESVTGNFITPDLNIFSQKNNSAAPLILSYFSQMTDSVSVSLIATMDKALPNTELHFLNNPFSVQKISLQANQALYAPITDNKLRRDMEDYIYSEYIPSLYKSKDASKVVVNPSSDIQNYLLSDVQGPWGKVKAFSSIFKKSSDIDNQIIVSIIQTHTTVQRQSFYFKWAGILQSIFPDIQGGANFLLYISFPFLLLVLMIFSQMLLLLRYLEVFVWIKSWILTSAVSHYVSLMAAYSQAQNETSSNWFWEYPYFSLIEVILLYLLPVITLIGIHRSFQIFNNR